MHSSDHFSYNTCLLPASVSYSTSMLMLMIAMSTRALKSLETGLSQSFIRKCFQSSFTQVILIKRTMKKIKMKTLIHTENEFDKNIKKKLIESFGEKRGKFNGSLSNNSVLLHSIAFSSLYKLKLIK